MSVKLVGFAGSLRKESFNRKLLAIAAEKARKAGASVEVIDLIGVPLYNQDVEDKGLPDSVRKLRDAIARADGVIIATPEYNHSFSGVTKNAVDWASREPNVFDGKVVAILGASTGGFGTVRAQVALRPVLAALNAWVLPQPQVLVSRAEDAFDAKGRLKDARAEEQAGKLVERLLATVNKLK